MRHLHIQEEFFEKQKIKQRIKYFASPVRIFLSHFEDEGLYFGEYINCSVLIYSKNQISLLKMQFRYIIIILQIFCLIVTFLFTDALPVDNEDGVSTSVSINDDLNHNSNDDLETSPLFDDQLEAAEQRRYRYPYRRLVKEFEFPALP